MRNNRESGSGVPAAVRLLNTIAYYAGLTFLLRRRMLRRFDLLHKQLVDARFAENAGMFVNTIDLQYSSFTGLLALGETIKAAFANCSLLTTESNQLETASTISIESPIFIVGFPRTGTSLLHSLLAEEPGYQAPLMWELHEPALSGSDLARRAMKKKVQQFVNANNLLAPNLKNVHPMFVNGNEECLKLLENAFFSPTFLLYNQAPGYESWMLEQLGCEAANSAYEMHKLQLQLLNSNHGRRGTWVLKSPAHALLVNSIRQVYPDSLLINTHRNPVESIASFCSLAETIRSIFDQTIDRHEIGQLALRFYAHSCAQYLELVRKTPNGIVEVSFDALCKSPVGVVQKIYELLELPFDSQQLKDRIDAWMSEDAQKLKSKHKYDVQHYGLDETLIKSRFKNQIERLSALDALGGIAMPADLNAAEN
ncbi:MAG: sulfotransferase [Pseudomonadales bacterium]